MSVQRIVLDLLFQIRQPIFNEMNILKDDPMTLSPGQIQGRLCHHFLTLAQGDVVEITVLETGFGESKY